MNDNEELEQIVDSEETKPDSDVMTTKRKAKTRKKNWRIARKKAQKVTKESRKRNR